MSQPCCWSHVIYVNTQLIRQSAFDTRKGNGWRQRCQNSRFARESNRLSDWVPVIGSLPTTARTAERPGRVTDMEEGSQAGRGERGREAMWIVILDSEAGVKVLGAVLAKSTDLDGRSALPSGSQLLVKTWRRAATLALTPTSAVDSDS